MRIRPPMANTIRRRLVWCCSSHPRFTETLLCLNCLADKLAKPSVFGQIEPRFLEREHRFAAFLNEIKRQSPSLLLLQEAAIVDYPRLYDSLASELGFDGIQQSRTTPVPLAAFWKKASFTLTWSEERSRVLICEFKHRASATVLYVLNVHLQGAPDDTTSLTRVSQLHKALRRLEVRLQHTNVRPERAKVFVVGDFNSKEDDDPCRFMRQRRLDASHEATTHTHVDEHGNVMEVIEHPFFFVEAYESFDRRPEFTHVRNGVGTRVDFLWSQGVDVERVLDVLSDGETWSSERAGGWPSEARCSDHGALGCTFLL